MVRVVLRDMDERVFVESDFSENTTIQDLKRHLVMEFKKDNSFAHILEKKYIDLTKEILGFHFFYNKKVVAGDIPVSVFSSDQEVCLYFVMDDILGLRADLGSQENIEIEVQEIDDMKPQDKKPTYRKVSVIVDEKKIVKKNGRLYLVVHRRPSPRLSKLIKKFVLNLRKDLIIKISVIILLVAMKNIEVASILTFILALKFLGRSKIRVCSEFRNLRALVFRVVFFFFYTMFIISADDSIQAA